MNAQEREEFNRERLAFIVDLNFAKNKKEFARMLRLHLSFPYWNNWTWIEEI